MNPNDQLANLANGVQVCNTTNPLDPNVVAALAAAATQSKTITKVGNAPVLNAIDLANLAGSNQNVTEFTFTNDTAQTITYWLTTLFPETGEPSRYGITNSAVDFPAAHGSDRNGTREENGGNDLWLFNNMVVALRSTIIGRIEVQTSNVGGQQNQNLITRYDNIVGDACNTNRIAPLCTACFNSGTSDTFVATFKCPLPLGLGYSVGYPVLAGESVTFRVTSIAVPVDNYQSIGGDCGC